MLQSYAVTKVIPLPVSAAQYVNNVEKENEPMPNPKTIGGILLNTKHIWTANGSYFTVTDSNTGHKIAAWNFGSVVKDYSTTVVCVDELSRPAGKPSLLVIGLASAITGGMICIFDISGSRVLRAIQIKEKVTSLHVIDGSYDKCPLPGPLRAFDGVLAVGTAAGNVLLMDICRHACDEVSSGSCRNDIRDEINSCPVETLFFDDIHSLELYKQGSTRSGNHLAIHLNVTESNVTPHFILKGPKGDDRVHVNKEEVIVSALHYCPQLGSLLVGYNFGAWQIWNLIDLQLVYTSPIYEENVPAAHFAVQEPCDDPRAFCYVWVIYSIGEPYQRSCPLSVLYALNYDTKEWHEGYGTLYQDLTSCSVRFQADLTLFDEINSDNVQQGAYCLRLQSINKLVSKGAALQDQHEETIALCSIVWNGWSSKSNMIHTYMSLFDLNQWYKEQMPNTPKLQQCGRYMTHVCLSKLLPPVNSEVAPFLDVRMNLSTLSQFFGSHKLEEHYYPNSLAFQLCALRKNDVVFFNNQGSQRALLSHLEYNGPSILLKPTVLFQQSVNLGLYPLFVDVLHNASLDEQRELILSVALEQQLLGWLCKCVSLWTTGSTGGCTLQFLLSWGWQRALMLKQNADKLCIPLFDYSGLRLDANNHNLLSNCARQLKNLATLFGYIVKKFARFLLHPDIVKDQWESLQMVSVHLDVLQWLLNVGLLPECPISKYPRADEFNRISAPYPVNSLMKYYDERRTNLQTINKEHFSTSGSLLFIDNLIELECGGQKVQKLWEEDDGTGLYPPPSLQALLRTYLIEGVEISFKHCIVVYVFLDLAMTLDQSRYKPIITHLIKFPAVFQLSPSIIKITQAFWQLDHGDISTAMEQLLDPLVCSEDLKMWHHRVALKALLAQNQYKFALLYLQVRQPAVTEVEDLCIVLSLYIANNMLHEAFHFQRQNRSVNNEEKLLQHFYRECDKKGEISAVIHLPLMQIEEEAFIKYLHAVEHPKLQDLQVFYYMQRSQYVDAFTLNDKLNLIKLSNKGLNGQSSMGFRDLMVKEFTDTLPGISKSLMTICQKDNTKQWKEVARPEPLSVYVYNTNEQAKYKSTIIHTALSKAKETWTHPVLNATPQKRSMIHPITEEMPFLNTPKAAHSESRTSIPLIFPKTTTVEEIGQDEDGLLPIKRFKPSPRLSSSTEKQKTLNVKNINTDITCNNLSVKLNTPIIKRKISGKASRYSDEKFSAGTPQSILKVYNLMRNSKSPDSATVENKNVTRDIVDSTPLAHEFKTSTSPLSLSRKISLGLTPRKPLPRTLGVRFDISRGSSESSLTSEPSIEIVHEAMIHSPVQGIRKRESELKPNTTQESITEVNSKNSSLSTDEFYSPDASISSNTESKTTMELQSIVEIDESKVLNQQVLGRLENVNAVKTIQATDEILVVPEPVETETTTSMPSSPKTPRSRRSYRGSLPEMGVRSSPRLRKSLLQTVSEQQQPEEKIAVESPKLKETLHVSQSTELLTEESPRSSVQEKPLKSKLRGRRPLSRQVLENNTFSRVTETSIAQQEPLLSSSSTQLEISLSKIDRTIESKESVELIEECKEKGSVLEDSNNSKDSPKDEHVNSKIISSLDNHAASSFVVSSTNISDDHLDSAYVSDTMPQPSTSFVKDEDSIHSDKDVKISPLEEQVADSNDENLQEQTAEEAEQDKNDPQISGVYMDQQEDSSAESEEDGDEIMPIRDAENKEICDSDADTVVIESDLLTDTANIYDDLSSDNNFGSTDPQMNVFEISDDLDLNEGMCLGTNTDILEIDTNYTTSANDDEVFADNSEVLTDVIAINEASSEQFETSEVNECNKTLQDLKSVPYYEEAEKENEVIEVGSSSDEDDSRDETSESSYAKNSDSSRLSSSIEEEYVNNEEVMYEENSEHYHDDQSVSDNSEQDLIIKQTEVSKKEVLSESEYSVQSAITSNDNSRESYSSGEHYAKSATEYEEIKEEGKEIEAAEGSNNDLEEFSSEISAEISEEVINTGHLEVILEEASDQCSDEGEASVSPKVSETVKFAGENVHLDHTSVETVSKESHTCKTDLVEDMQLVSIPEEVQEVSIADADLAVIPEKSLDSYAFISENASNKECNKTESSEVPGTLPPHESVDIQTPSNSEISLSVEQQTVVEVRCSNDQIISKQKTELSNETVFSKTDILDKTQSTELTSTNIQEDTKESDLQEEQKLLNESVLSKTDILDKTQGAGSISTNTLEDTNQSDLLEKTDVKLEKIQNLLSRTDILDATMGRSAIYLGNSMDIVSSLNATPSDSPAATTDILDKSDSETGYNLHALNQTDILDRTTASFENEISVTDIYNDVFKENLEKSSTPARRSRRLSSLQLTPSDQLPMRRTRRSASFNIPQKSGDLSQPSTSKDGALASSSKLPSARQLRSQNSSTEAAPPQAASTSKNKLTATNDSNTEKPIKKQRLRSSSISVEAKDSEAKSALNTRSRRASSVHVDLPVIKEEAKAGKSGEECCDTASTRKRRAQDLETKSTVSESATKKLTVKKTRKSKSTVTAVASKNKIEAYSTTRRLTRRQAVLLQKNLGSSKMDINVSELQHHVSESEDSDNEERGPDMKKIDPINLLNKPSFEGKHDSDEEKNIQQSPPSSVPESPIGTPQRARRLRSQSSVSNISPRSEVSTVPSLSEAGTPTKGKRSSVKRSVAGTSTRKQRSKSVDETANQKQYQDMPSPPKLRKTRQGSKELDSGSDISSVSKTRSLVETKKSTLKKRTRSASVQNIDEAEQGKSLFRRSARSSRLAKSQMPQIIEEPNSESDKPKATKRNLRNQSSAKK